MAESNLPATNADNSDPTFAEAVRAGHEPSTLPVRSIVITGAALFLLAACSMAVVALVMKSQPRLPADTATAAEEWKRDATDPGVEPNQALDRLRLAEQNRRQLDSYGWANDEHNAARIPIDRALEMMAERKLDVTWRSSNKEATP